MRKWTKKHTRFVGRVIFANFLELSLKRYKNFIEETEQSFYRKGGGDNLVTVKYLSKAKLSINKSPKVIAKIAKSGNGFSIRYTHEGFNKIYITGGLQHAKLFYKFRRVSSRNELTHRIIKGIIERQKRYLETGNTLDLVPFSQVDLGIDNSWTSRLVNRLSVITPSGEEKPLRWFFQTQKDINKRFIKQLLDKENEDIESGRLKKPLTDNQIKTKLESEYGVKLSRHSVGLCRKDMGIPPAKRRLSGYKYPPLSANFSLAYPLTMQAVLKFAPASSGVYEFSFKSDIRNTHHAIRNTIFYIGSTKDIRKRLREHLGKNSKNGHIKDFLKKYTCSFRYILIKKNWQEEEKRLYRLFLDTYGSAPKCNRIRP